MELFDNIKNLDKEKETYLNNYLSSIKKYPYIYLRGISESCDEAINFFQDNNINIKGIYELNPDKYDYKYKNIDVVKQTFDDIDSEWAIVITCSYYETIKNKLLVFRVLCLKSILHRLTHINGTFNLHKKVIKITRFI